jgi:hypothetical protein
MKVKGLVLLCLTFLLASCDKYEQGGYLYQTPHNIRGTWEYEEVVANHQPVLDSAFESHYRHSTVTFERGSTAVFHWVQDSTEWDEHATYVFNYNKTKLCVIFDAYPLDEQVWEVDRLTRDEFWFSCVLSDEESWYMKLKKKSVK